MSAPLFDVTDTFVVKVDSEPEEVRAAARRLALGSRAELAEARLSDFKTMLQDIREQRDRWQQQAERVAALAITDQRKKPAPEQPYLWRPWLRPPR